MFIQSCELILDMLDALLANETEKYEYRKTIPKTMGLALTKEGVEREHKRQIERFAAKLKAQNKPIDDAAFWEAVLTGQIKLQTEPYEETARRRQNMAKLGGVVLGSLAVILAMDLTRVLRSNRSS